MAKHILRFEELESRQLLNTGPLFHDSPLLARPSSLPQQERMMRSEAGPITREAQFDRPERTPFPLRASENRPASREDRVAFDGPGDRNSARIDREQPRLAATKLRNAVEHPGSFDRAPLPQNRPAPLSHGGPPAIIATPAVLPKGDHNGFEDRVPSRLLDELSRGNLNRNVPAVLNRLTETAVKIRDEAPIVPSAPPIRRAGAALVVNLGQPRSAEATSEAAPRPESPSNSADAPSVGRFTGLGDEVLADRGSAPPRDAVAISANPPGLAALLETRAPRPAAEVGSERPALQVASPHLAEITRIAFGNEAAVQAPKTRSAVEWNALAANMLLAPAPSPAAKPEEAVEGSGATPRFAGLLMEMAPLQQMAALESRVLNFLAEIDGLAEVVTGAPTSRLLSPWLVTLAVAGAACEIARRQLRQNAQSQVFRAEEWSAVRAW